MAIKILVIEDSLISTLSLKEIFESKGYAVATADSGEHALEVVKTFKPDLALVDTCLPGMSGHDVCRQLRKLFGQRIKIIVYTGHVDAVDAAKAIKAGANDYVVKTSDFSLLLDAIKKLT